MEDEIEMLDVELSKVPTPETLALAKRIKDYIWSIDIEPIFDRVSLMTDAEITSEYKKKLGRN